MTQSPPSKPVSHCEALLSQREAPVELGPEFERFGARLASALKPSLAKAAGDTEARVASLGVQEIAADGLGEHCPPLVAASRHLFGVADHTLTLALDGRAILEQLDRTFGGNGDIGETLPEKLPHTACVLAQRLERQIIAALASELGGLEFRTHDAAADDGDSAFAADAALSVLTIEVTTESGSAWRIVLAVETAALASLLPKRASAPRAPSSRRKPGIDEAPFAELPLAARARLVDMKMPLHRLADMAPGAVIPIMVARSVPLHVGDVVIARGTVGEVDDQVALQITQTLTGKENR